MDQFNRTINHIIVGKSGPASITVIFKKSEFDEKLAPSLASIVYIEGNDGEALVKMTYPL